MMREHLLRLVIVFGLLALAVSSAQAQGYNYTSIDYPNAVRTRTFGISLLVRRVFYCTVERFLPCCFRDTMDRSRSASHPPATFTAATTISTTWDRCSGSLAQQTGNLPVPMCQRP